MVEYAMKRKKARVGSTGAPGTRQPEKLEGLYFTMRNQSIQNRPPRRNRRRDITAQEALEALNFPPGLAEALADLRERVETGNAWQDSFCTDLATVQSNLRGVGLVDFIVYGPDRFPSLERDYPSTETTEFDFAALLRRGRRQGTSGRGVNVSA